MGERIKELRKALGLTQQEFADRLGVVRSNIATYEVGKSNLGGSVISLICREFDVSEEWLRTGQGEMFVELTPDEEFDKLCLEIQLSDDELIKKIMRAYWRLDKEERQVVQKMINDISSK